MTRCETDPFQIVAERASDQSFDLSGPWLWHGTHQIVASKHMVFARRVAAAPGLSKPPTSLHNAIKTYRHDSSHRTRIAPIKAWAGEPLRIWCECACGNRHRIDDGIIRPGWLGDYLVDRRLIALALELTGSRKYCHVALGTPATGDGGPIRIWGDDAWWAIVMGLRTHEDRDKAPRFRL